MALKEESCSKCFDGRQLVYSHDSETLKCNMRFAVYLPPAAESRKVPVLYYLSGLTCTEQNVITKAGAQRICAKHNIALVCPDTSPRGVNLEGEDDTWQFGTGAGYYLNATQEPWSKHYHMFDYVTKELPALVEKELPVTATKSIFGHSMGGHGALICALKCPGQYASVTAFAPICNPSVTPVASKALKGYLGDDKAAMEAYDATCLVGSYNGPMMDILIDQGTNDGFYKDKDLEPEAFVRAAAANPNISVVLRKHEGYDHGYYFISSFMEDHVDIHAAALNEDGSGAAN
ncbi:uncharacterized protein MONBRDRAFT_32406 [Monosiga brevicollis MX1]|uniref:S-formylglutathione hydrolase n=1 Tax=Monosiga brevicollis TaxID=81824 RepID=A9UZC1_MONBE|nr:uncharacterized protein MONBRDRAFT_32406 [Monosiga brevicollis MX1]EDQ89341.1 predicted protein [Monosiga brevicollis MX1]|eukprot:XP_001745917.1 hypothetical protein [Monosiga brevicollis MX1]